MAESGSTPVVSKDPMARAIEAQQWLEAPAVATQRGLNNVFDKLGEPVRRALHGDWLHEPLHVVLTDVPVGAWTAAVVFDALAALGAGDKLDGAADASVVLGLVAAVGAAVTGMNDWSKVKTPAARKIGFAHAILNIAATGLFAGSCIARAGKKRTSARAQAALGILLVSASAHLGGNLIYEQGVGVAPRPGDSKISRDVQG